MCGIFGMGIGDPSKLTFNDYKSSLSRLFQLSESRGKEASGLAILTDERIAVFKDEISASMLVKSPKYGELLSKELDLIKTPENKANRSPIIAFGHSRLVTNGSQESYGNNQPVIKDGILVIHNGIVVNVGTLWEQYPDLERHYEVDTEIIASLTRKFYRETGSIYTALQQMFAQIEGSASVAILFDDLNRMVLATNNGSLYIARNNANHDFFFASEEYILRKFLEKYTHNKQPNTYEVSHIIPGTGYVINTSDLSMERFLLVPKDSNHGLFDRGDKNDRKIIEFKDEEKIRTKIRAIHINTHLLDPSEFQESLLRFGSSIRKLKRCTQCLLPETVPFIEFDENGVCNVCRNYRKHVIRGKDALEEALEPYSSKSGKPDCIVAFSGGRDSSFGLHYIKNVLKLNPVSYTYDWGMVTDLARRNISRICSKLGIENIVISADINKKRQNIRKNVIAWLKKPELGIVPLFMAGDKQFFYYAQQLKKRMGIPFEIWCFNIHEKANFKEEFSGIKMWDPTNKKDSDAKVAIELRWSKSLFLGSYYLVNFLKNPEYLNSSLFDTFTGYLSYYFLKKNILSLYDYIEWNEKIIETTLINEYNWETSPYTPTTWRIGDGTAAFYNYIYYTVAGFTENDWFRSNQIREGMITREEALRLVLAENQPMWESIKWYCDIIDIDYVETVRRINMIPKLYPMI